MLVSFSMFHTSIDDLANSNMYDPIHSEIAVDFLVEHQNIVE